MRSKGEEAWNEFCCGSGGETEGHGHEEHHRKWHERVRQFMEHGPREHWFFGGRRFMAWWATEGTCCANPLVGLMLSRGGGILPLLVLHLLAQGPRYGNDIMREIQVCSRRTWASNPGAIYPLLRLFEGQGLVSGEWENATRRTRRMYRLTDVGQREYSHLKELMEPGLREAIEVMKTLYDELYAVDATGPKAHRVPVEP